MRKGKIKRFIEDTYPYVLGVMISCGWLYKGTSLARSMIENNWHFDNIYGSILGFLSITTGFLATFYGTVQSVNGGYIGRIKNSPTYRRFISYLKHSIIVGLISSLATIPLTIAMSIPVVDWSASHFIVSAWLGVSTCTTLMFFRVAIHLFYLFETTVPVKRPGG